MCVSGFSSEKPRYGRLALHFILSKYFIWILHFFGPHTKRGKKLLIIQLGFFWGVGGGAGTGRGGGGWGLNRLLEVLHLVLLTLGSLLYALKDKFQR